ncbi:MAG TPA: hypothetical protein VH234_04935, partial [Candidatus Saccharimonadales bacterium]|nr:hypothetical protein [Candidatus Saccharimonadales bacterium]
GRQRSNGEQQVNGGEAKRTADQGELVCVPLWVQDYYAVRDTIEGLSMKLGVVVEPEDLLQFRSFTFTVEAIRTYRQHRKKHLPFEDVFSGNEDNDIAPDEPNDPHSVVERELPHYGITNALGLLKEREARVVALKIGLESEPKNGEQIARELGITRQGVDFILKRAYEKLKTIPDIREVIQGTTSIPEDVAQRLVKPPTPQRKSKRLNVDAQTNNDIPLKKAKPEEIDVEDRVRTIEEDLLRIVGLPESERPSEKFIAVRVSQLIFFMHKLLSININQPALANQIGIYQVAISQTLAREVDYAYSTRNNVPQQLCSILLDKVYDNTRQSSAILSHINPTLIPLLNQLRNGQA